MEKSSRWVVNYIGTVRPNVTYLLILELIAVNAVLAYYVWQHPHLVQSMDDLIKVAEIIFSDDEMAMIGTILGFWFGSRSWGKK
jgi:hypothetical protein